MTPWTKEKIAALAGAQLTTLRENAIRLQSKDVADMCDEELANRKPIKMNKLPGFSGQDHAGQYVAEFHFVCPNELGVTRNSDGTIWTGTWVVATDHAKSAVERNSLVALHSLKAEPSYMQGIVIDWRKNVRQSRYTGDHESQIAEGIDFLFNPSDRPSDWQGDGAGEKGYAWATISS